MRSRRAAGGRLRGRRSAPELADETGVRVIGASDGFDSANPQSSLLLPVLGSMNEAFITQLRSKVKRGMDDAFRRGDNIQPPGVGYRLVDVRTPVETS
jgi:DNA invertase Pin-like site-specific DNA recombinase